MRSPNGPIPVRPHLPLKDLVVLFGHAQQVGDDQQGEGAGEVGDELALPSCEELVDLAIGELLHELLVLLEPLRRDQPHQQRTVCGVLRRIERRDLIVHR